jgi:3-deoxy-D-manno-octulosonic-acid transferase
MIRLLYGFALRAYQCMILLVSPFNPKARLWINGRKGLLDKIRGHFAPNDRVVWFHAASLGEFEQGRPLMEAMKAKDPSIKLLVTFFSPSGYEVRKNFPLADLVCYLPLDTPGRMKKFVDAVHPETLIIIKYEFWYNLFSILKNRNVKIYLAAGIFREQQHFFQWWGKWFLQNLNAISWFFVQDEATRQLLGKAGFSNVSVSGDTRFDRVVKIAEEAAPVTLPDQFIDGSQVVVAGSTWPQDEEIISGVIPYFPQVKWIIAPHQVDDFHVDQLMHRLPGAVRLSETTGKQTDARFLVVDSIGLLSSLYRFATIAYVGGGFGKGIHNLLEAAVYGCPVIFGPRHHIFREAHGLINAGGGFPVNDRLALQEIMDGLLNDPDRYAASAAAAKTYVEQGQGATNHILEITGYH